MVQFYCLRFYCLQALADQQPLISYQGEDAGVSTLSLYLLNLLCVCVCVCVCLYLLNYTHN